VVDQIQVISESVHQEIASHRMDYAQSHARIIEVQENQQQLNDEMRHVYTGQMEVRKKLTTTGKELLGHAV
jgi:hypothetical protein